MLNAHIVYTTTFYLLPSNRTFLHRKALDIGSCRLWRLVVSFNFNRLLAGIAVSLDVCRAVSTNPVVDSCRFSVAVQPGTRLFGLAGFGLGLFRVPRVVQRARAIVAAAPRAVQLGVGSVKAVVVHLGMISCVVDAVSIFVCCDL